MNGATVSSPRTPEKPMAFTWAEFGGGAARAVMLHFALFTITTELAGIALCVPSMINEPQQAFAVFLSALGFPILIMIYAVPISLIAMVIGLVPAFLVGRSMMSIQPFRTHLLVRCAFGIVFCGAVSLAVSHLLFGDLITPMSLLVAATFVSGAVSIPLAWARTASSALRKDRGLPPAELCRRRRAQVSPANSHG